jgi:hypothetical protein
MPAALHKPGCRKNPFFGLPGVGAKQNQYFCREREGCMQKGRRAYYFITQQCEFWSERIPPAYRE